MAYIREYLPGVAIIWGRSTQNQSPVMDSFSYTPEARLPRENMISHCHWTLAVIVSVIL